MKKVLASGPSRGTAWFLHEREKSHLHSRMVMCRFLDVLAPQHLRRQFSDFHPFTLLFHKPFVGTAIK
jgi:hypothetical protein